MTSYTLEPRTGYSADEARNDPNPDSAKLVVRDRGMEKEIPLYKEIQQIFGRKMKFDEGMLNENKFRYQGTDVSMWSQWPIQQVSSGLNPYKQLVYRFIKNRGARRKEDVYEHLVGQENVLRDTDHNKEVIDKFIDDLVEDRLLQPTKGIGVVEEDSYKLGSKNLRDVHRSWGLHFVRYERGKHIIKNEIYKRIRDADGMRRDEIVEYISSKLMWCSAKITKSYLKDMVEEDILALAGDEYETKNPLPPL